MLWLICVLLINLSEGVIENNVNCIIRNTDNNDETRLLHDLFCMYDKYTRPKKEWHGRLNVTVSFSVMYIETVDRHNTLNINGKFIIEWHDIYLLWKPQNYNNITKVDVFPSLIWTPDMTILNTAEQNLKLINDNSVCFMEYTGKVICSSKGFIPGMCEFNFKYWPYDKHHCYLMLFTTIYENANYISLMRGNNTIDMKFFVQNNNWKLIKYEARFIGYEGEFGIIEYVFDIQRYSAPYIAAVIIPALVVSTLTLISFWFEAGKVTRITINCTAIIIDILFIQYIGFLIWGLGDTVPLILKFYRDQMFVSIMAIIVGYIIVIIKDITIEAPSWLSTGIILLMRLQPIRFIFGVDQCLVTSTWIIISIIINRLLFILFIIIHYYLITTYTHLKIFQ